MQLYKVFIIFYTSATISAFNFKIEACEKWPHDLAANQCCWRHWRHRLATSKAKPRYDLGQVGDMADLKLSKMMLVSWQNYWNTTHLINQSYWYDVHIVWIVSYHKSICAFEEIWKGTLNILETLDPKNDKQNRRQLFWWSCSARRREHQTPSVLPRMRLGRSSWGWPSLLMYMAIMASYGIRR